MQITIEWQPTPQPRHRVAARGTFAHAYIPAKHAIHGYKAAIVAAAHAAGVEQTRHPVYVLVECVVARPKSHWNKGGLKPAAPAWPRMDWDNLAKGVCDALTGIAWYDDDQILDGRCSKRFGDRDELAYTTVTIRELEG